jgi:Arc/MetJ-type ribon-helix-helix transcriptional regulator
MTQLVTRLSDDLAAAVDRLVQEGAVEERSDGVRRGLELLVDRHRRQQVAAASVRGYEVRPQIGEKMGWGGEAARRMIAEEPW